MPRHFSIRSADNLNKIPKAIEKISPFHRYWANAIFVSPLGRCLHILARHCCPSSNVLSIRRQSQTKSTNEKSKGIRDHAAPRRYIGTCHNTPISHTLLSPCGCFSCSSRRLEGAAGQSSCHVGHIFRWRVGIGTCRSRSVSTLVILQSPTPAQSRLPALISVLVPTSSVKLHASQGVDW